jgi:hypothetical protein
VLAKLWLCKPLIIQLNRIKPNRGYFKGLDSF